MSLETVLDNQNGRRQPQTESDSHAHYSLRSTVPKQAAICPCDGNHMSHLLNTELLRWLSGGPSPESQKQQGMCTEQMPCDFYYHGHLGKAALETVYVPVSGLNSKSEALANSKIVSLQKVG